MSSNDAIIFNAFTYCSGLSFPISILNLLNLHLNSILSHISKLSGLIIIDKMLLYEVVKLLSKDDTIKED